MTWRALRPVGDTISSGFGTPAANPASCFAPARVEFYDSGTSALAAALRTAVATARAANPEVILPAYGCPSLVAATLYAGARPVLADLAVEKLSPSVTEIENLISANTVAIVQVDLFGLPSISEELKQLASDNDIQLIHDCAQACISIQRLQQMENELVVLSFGRGKPISVLGGGALLRRPVAGSDTEERGDADCQRQLTNRIAMMSALRQRLAYLAYNLAIWPPMYNLIERLPLGLGETRFKALAEIKAADPAMLAFLPANFNKQTSTRAVNRNLSKCELYRKLLVKIADSGWVDLVTSEKLDKREKLLRYPLLAPNAELREQLIRDQRSRKLGLTAMYQLPLAEIEGIPMRLTSPGAYPNATSVAARLVTLPLHDSVTEQDISQIGQLLCSYS